MSDLISREKLLEDIRDYQMDVKAKATAIHCIKEQKQLSTMTADEAWNLAIRVSELPPKERAEYFKIEDAYTGDILKYFNPKQVKVIFDTVDPISARDVVIVKNTQEKAIVIYANANKDMYKVLFSDSDIVTYKKEELEKTGRRIDIEKILEGAN